MNNSKDQWNWLLVLWKDKLNRQTFGQTHQENKGMGSNKIRNGSYTTFVYLYTTEIQRIIRDYYQQLYASKMNNLAEMTNSWKGIISQDWNRKKHEQTNYKYWSWNCDQNDSPKLKVQDRWLHRQILSNI